MTFLKGRNARDKLVVVSYLIRSILMIAVMFRTIRLFRVSAGIFICHLCQRCPSPLEFICIYPHLHDIDSKEIASCL
jgi:hypothetical protein